MATTVTSDWFTVNNGEITTHDPQDMSGETAPIEIQSAEIQWEGITTSPDTKINKNTSEKYHVDPGDAIGTGSTDFPPVDSGYDFDYYENYLILLNDDADDVDKTVDLFIEVHWSDTDTGDSFTNEYSADWVVPEVGEEKVIVKGEHYHNSKWDHVSLSINNNESTGGPDVSIQTQPRTHMTESGTTEEKTQDPAVSGDVSADSGTLTLNDGEQSSWFALSGLDPNNEDFFHDISGSETARFRFRFDYVLNHPTPQDYVRIYDADAGVKRKVALADPTDSKLKYNAIRVDRNGNTYALDVVNPGDQYEIDFVRFYHPTHGTLVPRQIDTV